MKNTRSAFTLLELIVVIIIVGVLASLALPRFTKMVQRSYAVEGINDLKVIRDAVERCYLMSGSYTGECTPFGDMSALAIDDPFSSPNSHFAFSSSVGVAQGFAIIITRNNKDNPLPSSSFRIDCSPINSPVISSGALALCQSGNNIKIVGGGVFEGMQWGQ